MKKKYIGIYVFIMTMSVILINLFMYPYINVIIHYDNIASIANKKVEIFYDTGNGFHANDKVSRDIDNDKVQFKIKEITRINGLRIDPVDIKGKVLIKEIVFQYGLEYLKIDKTNFNNYLKLINIRNIDLVDYISFESTNNDPIMIISNDMLMKIQKMGNKLNIKYILLNSMVVIIFYLLLLLIYIKRNIFIKYIQTIITSRKHRIVIINIFSIAISMFFMIFIYNTLIEVHFSNDIVPFSNEIKIYQQSNVSIPVSKTQFGSILINKYNKENDIIMDMSLNEFHVNKISLRQNTHLAFKINIKYNIENNKVYMKIADIKKSNIIYIIINVFIFTLIMNLLYCFF